MPDDVVALDSKTRSRQRGTPASATDPREQRREFRPSASCCRCTTPTLNVGEFSLNRPPYCFTCTKDGDVYEPEEATSRLWPCRTLRALAYGHRYTVGGWQEQWAVEKGWR